MILFHRMTEPSIVKFI